ncbi:protein arginine N-methyltransferase 5 [Oenanthe melanoleuca]|uniref:protein arginine N-methyltransferase 5 n=1 Tax=Oenanthe melanoleuca TaxID=2939378 RepID=UPI0024C126E0|nr:protein arginine N-methyltransferase 5 [Oenanthe melanoleuca]
METGTLIVGKLSPWIRPDSPLEHVRKNSTEALCQELDFGAYLGLAAHLLPLRGPHNPNLARGLSAHLHSGHHATQVLVCTGLYWFILGGGKTGKIGEKMVKIERKMGEIWG